MTWLLVDAASCTCTLTLYFDVVLGIVDFYLTERPELITRLRALETSRTYRASRPYRASRSSTSFQRRLRAPDDVRHKFNFRELGRFVFSPNTALLCVVLTMVTIHRRGVSCICNCSCLYSLRIGSPAAIHLFVGVNIDLCLTIDLVAQYGRVINTTF